MINSLLEEGRMYMVAVVAAFAAAGLPLDYFPETEDTRELWQYDGFDHGNDILVQLYVSVNGHDNPGIFGDCEVGGLGYDLTATAKYWMVDFGEKAIKAIAEGRPPF